MWAYSHFILLVVLVDHKLISTDRCKWDTCLLIQGPAIVLLLFLLRIELIGLVLVGGIRIFVVFIRIGVLTFAPAWTFQWVLAPITVNFTSLSVPFCNFSSFNMGQEALDMTLHDVFSIKLWLRFLSGLSGILGSSAFRWCRWASNIGFFIVSCLIMRWSNGTLSPLNYWRDITTQLHDRLLRCDHLGSLSCAKSFVDLFIWTWTVSVNSRVICRTALLLVGISIDTAYFSVSYSLYLNELFFTLVMGISSVVHLGALTLRLGLSWSYKVVHRVLCFHDFSFLFALLLAHSLVYSITIFIIGYIIYTSLATRLISFFLHLLIVVVHLLMMLFLLLQLVLAPSSKLHVAAVELDLGNKVCNGTILFLILIDWVILEGPLLFIQIEPLNRLCFAFLVSGAPLLLVRDWRVLGSVAIWSKEGYLLSCKHLWSSGSVC